MVNAHTKPCVSRLETEISTKKKPVTNITEEIVKKKKPYNRFHNIKSVDEDGNKWDSEWEREVWGHLKKFEESGKIKDLQRQVKIQLHSPHVNNDGKMILQKLCIYIADYTYFLPDDTYVIADAKSTRTFKDPVFRLKSKMVFSEMGSPVKIFLKGQPVTI